MISQTDRTITLSKSYQAGKPPRVFTLVMRPGAIAFALPSTTGDEKELLLYAEVISQMLADLPLMKADLERMKAI